jgi:Arm DNA-binding domain
MPKHIQPLTAKGLDAVRPRDGEVIELGDGLLPGLRVRVSGGGRFWSLNIRNANGERRRFDVGANLTLAEARRRAEALKKAIGLRLAGKLPTHYDRIIRRWISENQTDLKELWKSTQSGQRDDAILLKFQTTVYD